MGHWTGRGGTAGISWAPGGRALVAGLSFVLAGAWAPGAALADSSLYGVGLVTTTVAYRPHGGAFEGPLGDVSPVVGVGWLATSTISLELDLSATFTDGDYVGAAVGPGVLWAFHPNFYAAARALVPFDPEINFVLFPGVGALYTFANGVSPFVELNAASAIGRGRPDLGVAASVGALCPF